MFANPNFVIFDSFNISSYVRLMICRNISNSKVISLKSEVVFWNVIYFKNVSKAMIHLMNQESIRKACLF